MFTHLQDTATGTILVLAKTLCLSRTLQGAPLLAGASKNCLLVLFTVQKNSELWWCSPVICRGVMKCMPGFPFSDVSCVSMGHKQFMHTHKNHSHDCYFCPLLIYSVIFGATHYANFKLFCFICWESALCLELFQRTEWGRTIPLCHKETWTDEAITGNNCLGFLILLCSNKSIVLNTSRRWWAPDWQDKWSLAWWRDFSNGLFHLSSQGAHQLTISNRQYRALRKILGASCCSWLNQACACLMGGFIPKPGSPSLSEIAFT